jgi:hypothetical protein
MVAVIFSKGFGWIDDQFLVVEIAQSWADGIDYYRWLPWTEGNNGPAGFSFFYPGLHYVFFYLLDAIGFTNPQGKMYFVRLLHALWSLLIIKYGYEITQHFSDNKTARITAWILALYWIFPFLSVRNMVEFVCIPLIMKAILLIIKDDDMARPMYWIWIGCLLGVAFSIRFQTALITGGLGLVILFEKKWLQSIYFTLGWVFAVALIQGLIDYVIWGQPFAQMIVYVTYNATSAGLYTVGPWYHYVVFLLAMLIPPVSVYLFMGFFRSYRKLLILFLPTLIFIVFHSLYPNKQERFITTILPLFIISGVIGWRMIEEGLLNPRFIRKWIRRSWVFFWVLNVIAMIPVSAMYSKKARVETMDYLGQYEELNYFIIEDSNKDVLRFPPQYYLGKWLPYDAFMHKDNFNDFSKRKDFSISANQPGFVLFFMPDELEQRVSNMKKLFPELEYEVTIEPGLMDQLLHWLNPINANQNIYIYRNKSIIPEKKSTF